MFISLFSDEKKRLFLELCKYAAKSDDFFSPRQRVIVGIYYQEMGIFDDDLDNCKMELDDVLEQLQNKLTPYEKKEVTVEIIALLLCNRKLAPGESEFLHKMAKAFQLDMDNVDELVHATFRLLEAQENLVRKMMG